jgi:hypothetical protein
MTEKNETFQGWTNWETWAIALDIDNYYEFYKIARTCKDYDEFKKKAGLDGRSTCPEGVRWGSKKINAKELFEELFNNED